MESTLPPKAWALRFEPATGRRMLCAMSTLLLLGMTVGFVVSSSVASEAADCDPVGDVQFVGGQSGPGDLVGVPGAPWVLASGYAEGSGGIHLIDTRDLTTTVLAPTASPRERHDRVAYGSCPGPIVSVEKENFSTHGLYLNAGIGNVHTVYATHHGTRKRSRGSRAAGRPSSATSFRRNFGSTIFVLHPTGRSLPPAREARAAP